MHEGDWKPTGEPIIFDTDGLSLNGQHREWASLLGKVSFPIYLVSDAPPLENAFAYIDDVKARTSAQALKTADMNGVSSLLAQVIAVAVGYESGAYAMDQKRRTPRLSPREILKYARAHPLARQAAHLTAGEYQGACEAVGYNELVAFMAYRILSDFDSEVCDRFMEELEFDNPNAIDGDPGKAMRHFLAKQKKTDKPLKKHAVLGYLIRGFNAWFQGTTLKSLRVDTATFPTFVGSDQSKAEAEEELFEQAPA
jgi:hypothetical protein